MTVPRRSRRSFGSVRQRRPGARWEVRYPLDGRMVTAGTYAAKGDATRRLAQIEADLSRGEHRDPKAGLVTLAVSGRAWLDVHETHLAATTKASYRSILETVILSRQVEGREAGLGAHSVRSITPMTVKRWLAALASDPSLQASRIGKALGELRQILDSAVEEGQISVNPCGRIKRPRLPEPTPKILTPSEVVRIVAQVPAPFSLLVEILAWCGLRFSEAVELRRRDVDPMRSRLIVARAAPEVSGRHMPGNTKSHQQRSVPLPSSLDQALRTHLATLPADADTLLFPNRAGLHLHYKTFRRDYFDPACDRAHLHGTKPHALRASCASWVAATDGVLEAANRLGHANSSITTRHYARPVEGGDLVVASNLEAARNAAQEAERRRLAVPL